MDFKNKKVLIFGLGLNDGGVGMVKYFCRKGAVLKVTDLRAADLLKDSIDQLKDFSIQYTLGEHRKEDFEWADIIVRNPAIKRDNEFLKIARDNGAQILMEMALFHQLYKGFKIGITGTRGKSTTTSLIYEFVKEESLKNKNFMFYNRDVLLAGNIGKNAMVELENLNDKSVSVLELSSFQLDGMGENKVSPNLAVVTNMYPDHLNWHLDMDDYIYTKQNIFRYQNSNDVGVFNIENDITRTFIDIGDSQKIAFASEYDYIRGYENSLIDWYFYDKDTIFNKRGKLINLSDIDLKLEGDHNKFNILAAIAAVSKFDLSIDTIKQVLSSFEGLYGRQQFVRSVSGIDFFNDTAATTVEAVEVAIDRFASKYNKRGEKHLILIQGGVDKGLNYDQMVEKFVDNVKMVVLFEGTASDKIKECLDKKHILHVEYFASMSEAVNEAYNHAAKGDVIILTPAGSSFNMFLNEWDRGKQFDDAVNNLRPK